MGAISSQVTSLSITGEFPAQMASNAENVSVWWRHHAMHLHFGAYRAQLNTGCAGVNVLIKRTFATLYWCVLLLVACYRLNVCCQWFTASKPNPIHRWYGACIICWKRDFTSILSYWLGWYQNRVATPVTISMPWMHGGFPLILGYPHIRTLSTHYLYVSVPDGYDICVTSTLAVGRNASE